MYLPAISTHQVHSSAWSWYKRISYETYRYTSMQLTLEAITYLIVKSNPYYNKRITLPVTRTHHHSRSVQSCSTRILLEDHFLLVVRHKCSASLSLSTTWNDLQTWVSKQHIFQIFLCFLISRKKHKNYSCHYHQNISELINNTQPISDIYKIYLFGFHLGSDSDHTSWSSPHFSTLWKNKIALKNSIFL